MKRTPIVINWFEIWGDYWYEYLGKLGFFGKIVERASIKLPHRIIVETENTKNGLISWGYSPDRISIIPSGVSFEKIQRIPIVEERDRADIIYVGRLIDYKGIDSLIESVAHLQDSGRKVTLNIVGDGPQRGDLEQRVKELHIEDRTKFFGLIEDDDRVISLMKGAKAFVYPATPLGGWALTPIEANACGIPVITSMAGPAGANEVVRDGYNGLVADRESPELLADKILSALDNAKLREAIRINGFEFARGLDWENQASAVEAVYESCLTGRHERRAVL